LIKKRLFIQGFQGNCLQWPVGRALSDLNIFLLTENNKQAGDNMKLIFANIKAIMIVAGLLTCTMIFAVVAPEAALIGMFGESLSEPLAQVLVRSWGFLIFLMGALLIYGAYKPVYRNLALGFVGISKLVFVSLLLVFGSQYIGKAAFTILLDSVLAIVFFAYLVRAKSLSEDVA